MKTDYDSHHNALDERIIGFCASCDRTGYCVGFDGAIVVRESEDELKQWLRSQGISADVCVYPARYGGIAGSIYQEGIPHFFDTGSLQRLHAAKAEDHRFVPAWEEWESEMGTNVEAIYNPHRDSVRLLQEQLAGVTVGYHLDDELSASDHVIPVFGVEEECRSDNPEDLSLPTPITWSEYVEFERWGVHFAPDEISGRLIEELRKADRFCEETLQWEEE